MIFALPFVAQGLFLRFADQHYSVLFFELSQLEVSLLILVFSFGKVHDVDTLFLCILLDCFSKSLGKRRQNHWRRDRKTHLLPDKCDQSTGQLQMLHVPVQIDPVNAFNVQRNFVRQDLFNREHNLPLTGYATGFCLCRQTCRFEAKLR